METDRGKIFPINLTARAAHRVAGNPDTTRPEDSVSNCYPGLDTDLRNLDRRFFPGLVFEFVARRDTDRPYKEPQRYGALLAYVDHWGDPDLQPDYLLQLPDEMRAEIELVSRDLLKSLRGAVGDALRKDEWYLGWIEQKGNQISMDRLDTAPASPLDGLFVWRLIRGLEPGPITIGLVRRDTGDSIVLNGWRRAFTHPRTGVLSRAYQPGELSQSLCSPWQHDFRDCTCHYWASNRPDVVFGAVATEEDAQQGNVLLDWMRADRSPARSGAAFKEMPLNRPYQMEHIEINQTWQQLSIVIDSTEIGSVYVPTRRPAAEPYHSPEEFADALRGELAPLEMTLALEYLYARFSIVDPEENPQDDIWKKWKTLRDDVSFARHYLMLTAVSEMKHLRWTNEMLWTLARHGLIPKYEPVLDPSRCVPTSDGKRERALRPLEPKTLSDFVAAERPTGTLDGAYARTLATLAADPIYPRHLGDLAGRIVDDGIQHYWRLLYVQKVLQAYEPNYPYLRPLPPGTPDQAEDALRQYESIRSNLASGFSAMARGEIKPGAEGVERARAAMLKLLEEGEKLAREKNVGIPFWI